MIPHRVPIIVSHSIWWTPVVFLMIEGKFNLLGMMVLQALKKPCCLDLLDLNLDRARQDAKQIAVFVNGSPVARHMHAGQLKCAELGNARGIASLP